MTVKAAWQRKRTGHSIRVQMSIDPGELHPRLTEPVEVEEWLRALLESHRKERKTAASKEAR